jgi:hypothetical protein
MDTQGGKAMQNLFLSAPGGVARRWMMFVLFLFPLCFVLPARAQSPDMSNVTDVLGGQRSLLQIDDLLAIQSSFNGTTKTAGVYYLPTDNSGVSSNFTFLPNFTAYPSSMGGDTFAVKMGWFFNRPTQIPIAFSAFTSNKYMFAFFDPQKQVTFEQQFQSTQPAVVPGHEQAFAGDFIGSGYEQPVLLYFETDNNGHYFLTSRIVAAADPNNVGAGVKFGPPFVIVTLTSAVDPVVAVGNFRGNGRQDIAILLPRNDGGGQVVNFYQVDPATLSLSLVTSATLKDEEFNARTALAAGRFRTSGHDDLAVVNGIIDVALLIVQAVGVTPGNGSFTAQIGPGGLIFNTPIATHVLAQAGPLQDYTTDIDQLAIVANGFDQQGLWIGSFDQNMALTTLSTTNIADKTLPGCAYSMAIGNFDHQNPDGSRNRTPSIALYQVPGDSSCQVSSTNQEAQVQIWPVNPTTNSSDWFSQGLTSSAAIPNPAGMTGSVMVAGDLGGRSVRVGAPEKVTITSQIQPEMVLGLPPMHVDYIDAQGFFKDRGCMSGQPCLVNLTVDPTAPAPAKGFSTAFSFASSSSTNSQRKSTTSWSVGVKASLEEKLSFGLPGLDSLSVDLKANFAYAHDHTVAKTYNTYNSTTDSLSITTGFSDFLLYSEHRQNFYYYPVLGHLVCPANNPGCSDDQKVPLHVVYSVPDQVYHISGDASQAEWYQPIQEPGNVFSYPWTSNQLENELHATPLTTSPAPTQTIGTSKQTYSTQWSKRTGQSSSTGTTNSFAEGLGITASGQASDLFLTLKVTASVDVNSSQSFGSLNVGTQALDSSEGVSINNPGFSSEVGQCCVYAFSSYVLGMQPFASPLQDLKQPTDISTTGPLFVGFNADITGAGSPSPWWGQVYTRPDIGLNHPSRWSWSNNTVSFNARDTSIQPEDDPFYQMKGFFITRYHGGAVQNDQTGPTLSQVDEGDKVLLTARVYNFSLVDTPPDATTYVSFYAQEFDNGVLAAGSTHIGTVTVDKIRGYEADPNTPNWVLASTPLDTTGYGNHDLVFWVLVYMLDSHGNLVAEMPSHGLDPNSFNPVASYTNISAVPTESYSNNVGLYGTFSPFFVKPPTAPGATAERTDGLAAVKKVSVPGTKLLLDQRVKVRAKLATSGTAAGPVTLIYYDGDPRKSGKSFAVQHLPYVAANDTYAARVFYQPKSCGVHNLFVVSKTPGASLDSTGSTQAEVVVDPVQSVEAISIYLVNADLNPTVSEPLQKTLDRARDLFKKGNNQAGTQALQSFEKTVQGHKGNALTDNQVANLTGQVEQITGCLDMQQKQKGKDKTGTANLFSPGELHQ